MAGRATPGPDHAAAVQRILDAGATIIGKTICDEFFYSVSGDNAHYGTPVNPRAPGRLPGGSSSGSASATAAGLCDFALGSDTGGLGAYSRRVLRALWPAPDAGAGRFSGAMAMAPSFDTGGWFASGAGRVPQGRRGAPGRSAPRIAGDADASSSTMLSRTRTRRWRRSRTR